MESLGGKIGSKRNALPFAEGDFPLTAFTADFLPTVYVEEENR